MTKDEKKKGPDAELAEKVTASLSSIKPEVKAALTGTGTGKEGPFLCPDCRFYDCGKKHIKVEVTKDFGLNGRLYQAGATNVVLPAHVRGQLADSIEEMTDG